MVGCWKTILGDAVVLSRFQARTRRASFGHGAFLRSHRSVACFVMCRWRRDVRLVPATRSTLTWMPA